MSQGQAERGGRFLNCVMLDCGWGTCHAAFSFVTLCPLSAWTCTRNYQGTPLPWRRLQNPLPQTQVSGLPRQVLLQNKNCSSAWWDGIWADWSCAKLPCRETSRPAMVPLKAAMGKSCFVCIPGGGITRTPCLCLLACVRPQGTVLL